MKHGCARSSRIGWRASSRPGAIRQRSRHGPSIRRPPSGWPLALIPSHCARASGGARQGVTSSSSTAPRSAPGQGGSSSALAAPTVQTESASWPLQPARRPLASPPAAKLMA
jgi:hypothetical protein